MRILHAIAAGFLLCMGCVAHAGPIWFHNDSTLSIVDTETRAVITRDGFDGLTAVAAQGNGGAWVADRSKLMRVDSRGFVQSTTALSLLGLPEGAVSRAQAPSDRVWTVVDRNTKEPIPSAWISIQYFQGIAAPGHGTTACMRSESFLAGVDGRFQAPPDGRFGQASPTASKLGYTKPLGRVNDASKREVYLIPFTGTQEEVFYNALQESQPSRCHSDEDHVRELAKRRHFLEQAAKLIDRSNAAQVSQFNEMRKDIEEVELLVKRR